MFCDLKIAYFVNSEVLNLKFFFIVELPQWGLGRFCGKFGFSSKAMNKRHH